MQLWFEGKEKTPAAGFVAELILWMRQVFPFRVCYPSKYIRIPQAVMLAPSWSPSVIKAARSWQILKLGKTCRIIPHSWFGCLFGIWCRFNKLLCKKWKPQAMAKKVVGWEGSRCACAAVELWACLLYTPESSTAGLQWHQAWAETHFLCMIPEQQIGWRQTTVVFFFFFSYCRVSSCLPSAYAVGHKKWMCKYFVSHSSPRSSFWNSKQAQNPKKISLSCE